jgi:hypothetical protein
VLVRVSATRFFSTGPGGLVGNTQVLDCYRLARFYHVSPTVFLEMGLSEVRKHLEHTIDLANIINRENSRDG